MSEASKVHDRGGAWRALWTNADYLDDWRVNAGPVVHEASPFWVDEGCPRADSWRPTMPDPKAILVLLEEAGATLAGLRLSDGALVLRIARGCKSAQARIPDADADAARCGLAMTMAVDDDFPENLDRAAAVCTVAWPRR